MAHRRHKILHVSEGTGWSGGIARLLEISKGLQENGWRQWISCRPESALVDPAKKIGLEFFHLPLSQDYDLASAIRMARFIAREDIAIVHAHHPKAHAICLLAKFLLTAFAPTGVAPILVVSRRVSFAMGKNPFSLWKYTSRLIDAHFAVAESIKDILVSFGVSEPRVHVIRSGVDIQKFSPRPADHALRKDLGLPSDKKIIGKIGNASPWKGQIVFLKAASLLEKRGLSLHYLLVGRDTDSPWVREELQRLNLHDSVTLAGFRDDIPGIISLLAVSVNAAVKGEGLSGALREALAMENPVVASDTAGNRELVRHEETGLLCIPDNPESLADQIEILLKDPKRASALAKKGNTLVREEFNLELSIRTTIKHYESLLDQPPKLK